MRDYISLHNHTIGSIGDSLITPKELIIATKQAGQKAVALTDHGSLSSIWSAYKEAKKADIKLIAGCECYFVNDADNSDDTTLRHLVLLAKNSVGYKNLLTINKRGYDKFTIAFKRAIPRIDWKMLKEFSDGLICTSACGNGIIAQYIMQDQIDLAKNAANQLRSIFGDDFVIELQPHNLQRRLSAYSGAINQQKINLGLKKISEELGIKCIVATDAHYLKKEHHKAHDVYICNSSGQPITSGSRLNYDKEEFYVKNSDEVYNYFIRHIKIWGQEFVESLFINTVDISNKCEQPDWIDPAFVTGDKCQLPDFPFKNEPDYEEFCQWKINKTSDLYKENITEDSLYFRFKSEKGLNEKINIGKIPSEDRNECITQMLEEFDVFEYRGFSSYMLIVADFLNWCVNNDIPIGPGRGCTTKNTLVLTPQGYKSIIDLKGGDQVFSKEGSIDSVVCLFNNGKSNDLIKIKTCRSFYDQTFTKDHQLFALKKNELKNGVKPYWIEAGDIKIGDWLFHPWPNKIEENQNKIDLSKFIDTNRIKIFDNYLEITERNVIHDFSIRQISRSLNIHYSYVRNCKNSVKSKYDNEIETYLNSNNISLDDWRKLENKYNIPRYIEWDSDFCYLLGRWVGDGSLHGKNKDRGITIVFNSKDTFGISRIQKILTKYFGKIYRNNNHGGLTRKNCVALTVCGSFVSNLFKNLFKNYKTSESKEFPSNFRFLNQECLTNLILGYFYADGSVQGKYSVKFKTISKTLALQTREALLYLKIPSSTHIDVNPRRNGNITKTAYSCTAPLSLFSKILLNNNQLSSSGLKYDVTSNGFYCRVINVENSQEDETFDIKVKHDSSYLSSSYAVHNSVGGSLTAYLNNIHQAYPKTYGLIFARFLNKYKDAYPDIDVDISPSGRLKLHNYLRQKYNPSNVAHVSNINTITPKVYARDIARVFDFGGEGRTKAAEIGNAIADSIPKEIKTIKQALTDAPLFIEYVKQYPELAEFAEILSGKPRAWSTHAGGIVISKVPIEGLVPLRRDTAGALVLEYDKYVTEENGLIKIDTLGLETLDIIKNAFRLISENGKEVKYFDYEIEDDKAYNLISKGDNFGIFQLETTAVPICKQIKPKNISDISLISALIRPAAKDIIPDLIKVRDGKEEMKLIHPKLKRAFENTYGFGLYEESLLFLALDISGWDLHDADKLRKLTKEKGKNPEKVKQWREDFIKDSINNNIPEEIATKIWDETISGFGGYGFNKSLYFLENVDIFSSTGQFITSKPIKDVKPGEFVRSRDEETGNDIYIEVIGNHDHGELEIVEVELETGEKVKCTMNHKFRTVETGEMLPLHQILKEKLSIVVNKSNVCE